MRSHTLNVLGLEISFKAEADPQRVARAQVLLEERFAKLLEHGAHLSKEKLLTFLALTLADDYLILQDDWNSSQQRLSGLRTRIEKQVDNTPETEALGCS